MRLWPSVKLKSATWNNIKDQVILHRAPSATLQHEQFAIKKSGNMNWPYLKSEGTFVCLQEALRRLAWLFDLPPRRALYSQHKCGTVEAVLLGADKRDSYCIWRSYPTNFLPSKKELKPESSSVHNWACALTLHHGRINLHKTSAQLVSWYFLDLETVSVIFHIVCLCWSIGRWPSTNAIRLAPIENEDLATVCRNSHAILTLTLNAGCRSSDHIKSLGIDRVGRILTHQFLHAWILSATTRQNYLYAASVLSKSLTRPTSL